MFVTSNLTYIANECEVSYLLLGLGGILGVCEVK